MSIPALTHEFLTYHAALDALTAAGFGIFGADPRGRLIGYGDSTPQPPHGHLRGDARRGPVTVTLYHEAPTIARQQFQEIVAAQQAEAA